MRVVLADDDVLLREVWRPCWSAPGCPSSHGQAMRRA